MELLNGWKEISCISSKEREYLGEMLDVLVTTNGPSGKEENVLNFILEEIKKCGDYGNLKVVKSYKEFGLLLTVPSIEKPKQHVLFDAHVDTVCDFDKENEFMEPKYYRHKDKRVFLGRERFYVEATGIDNRLHSAILLCMIRFNRFRHIEYHVLFSIEEEKGQLGASRFSFSKEIFQRVGRMLDLIVILDVTGGILIKDIKIEVLPENSKKRKKRRTVIIGDGVLPINQPFIYNGDDKTNVRGFRRPNSLYFGIPKITYSCPCSMMPMMHEKSSFGSVSEMIELYEFLVSEFEKTMEEGKLLLKKIKVDMNVEYSNKLLEKSMLSVKIIEAIKNNEILQNKLCEFVGMEKMEKSFLEIHVDTNSQVTNWEDYISRWILTFSEYKRKKYSVGGDLVNMEKLEEELRISVDETLKLMYKYYETNFGKENAFWSENCLLKKYLEKLDETRFPKYLSQITY